MEYMPGPTPSIDSVNTNDRRPSAVTDGVVPQPPDWLNKDAKKIYRKVSKKIVALGVGASADEHILALFAFQTDRLIKLSKSAAADDSKSQRLLNDLSGQLLSLSREIGLTPSARAKMRIKAMQPDTDPLEDLLNDE
jgi:P27 family predicted phage terminase small subunit